MAMKAESEAADSTVLVDPQTRLAEWANDADEWVRLLVAEVIATGRPVGQAVIEKAYQLFREEKALDKREFLEVPLLDVETRQDESAPPLSLIRLSNVRGVNALTSGAVIEPHEGLTVLYGENGTGKTGYSRIFKALANSRTADTILGNIDADASEGQAAKLEFKLGDDEQVLTWKGELGVSPFTRMSIFDDPVSSLDHRRVKEVAQRIARLADARQVIVFTHDILFATTLLALFEKSKRCAYFQITDEGQKGKVSRATGPRIDTLKAIKGRINRTIKAAHLLDGEERDARVHTGYSHLRSWCEVFTEDELLKGVTRRYQANVQMTTLGNINVDKLGEIIPKVREIFEEACRYIDGHSQALITQGVAPTLAGLEKHWAELQKLKELNDGKVAS